MTENNEHRPYAKVFKIITVFVGVLVTRTKCVNH